MRTGGQLAGFLASVEGFPEDHVIKIDTKNTLEESFAQTNNVLGRIPAGVPIMATAINDQATTGILRAVKQAGREADLIVVGMGADELATMMAEPTFVASVGYFPERYGNFLVPMALAELAGIDLPPTVLVNHVMVTRATSATTTPTSNAPTTRASTSSSRRRRSSSTWSRSGSRRTSRASRTSSRRN